MNDDVRTEEPTEEERELLSHMQDGLEQLKEGNNADSGTSAGDSQ